MPFKPRHARVSATGLWLGSIALCALLATAAVAQPKPLTKEEEAKLRAQQQQKQQPQRPPTPPPQQQQQRQPAQPQGQARDARPPPRPPTPPQRIEPPVRSVAPAPQRPPQQVVPPRPVTPPVVTTPQRPIIQPGSGQPGPGQSRSGQPRSGDRPPPPSAPAITPKVVTPTQPVVPPKPALVSPNVPPPTVPPPVVPPKLAVPQTQPPLTQPQVPPVIAPKLAVPQPPIQPTPNSAVPKTGPTGPGGPTGPTGLTGQPPAVAQPAIIAPAPGLPPQIGAPRSVPQGTQPVAVTAPAGPARLDLLKQGRVERTDNRGRRIIEEPGNRTIIRQDNRIIVHRDEGRHVQAFYPNARATRLPGGITQTVYVRPDGVRIFSEVDGSGRLVRRYGRGSGGRDIIYVDNRRFYRNLVIGAGIGAVGIGIALVLAQPVHAVPRAQYIVDYDRASDDDIYEALSAPPVVRLERSYSLEEVRYSQPLRERMRRVDLDTITFDTGTFAVSEDQYVKLERAARAIGRAIEKNPAEMFLIEGHTDAVGSAEDNLTLSDRRAEAVARVLTEHFSIPMENLVTQGYGEQHLKVESGDSERVNRRVAFRRISPLLGQGG